MSSVKNSVKKKRYQTFAPDIKNKFAAAGNPQEEGEEEYNPHLHREVKKPTTNIETLMHFLKACIGTGILAMPEAFKRSGMGNGIVSTVIIGLICTYGLHILVRAQYVLCKRLKVPLLTYPESMRVACEVGPQCFHRCAPYAPAVTNFFLLFYQIGICCVYILFVAKNIKDVADQYTNEEIYLTYYILAIFIPFALILCVRNLKLLAPFSMVANLVSLVTFSVVLYYVCQNMKKFTDLPTFGTLFDYPLYVGTTLFSIQAIGVVIALENNMKNPENFRAPFGTLNVGMVIVTVVYVVMAVMGYWGYGDEIRASITLNFPVKDILGQVIKLMYSATIFVTYGLQGYVPIQIIWSDYLDKRIKKLRLFWEYMLRMSIAVVTFVLAITIPLLGLFISLIGAFCLSALGIVFPAMVEICTFWPNELGCGKWVLIKDICLIIIGIVGLGAGSFSCIYSIVTELSEGNTQN